MKLVDRSSKRLIEVLSRVQVGLIADRSSSLVRLEDDGMLVNYSLDGLNLGCNLDALLVLPQLIEHFSFESVFRFDFHRVEDRLPNEPRDDWVISMFIWSEAD